jgi:hypothetical protein
MNKTGQIPEVATKVIHKAIYIFSSVFGPQKIHALNYTLWESVWSGEGGD